MVKDEQRRERERKRRMGDVGSEGRRDRDG